MVARVRSGNHIIRDYQEMLKKQWDLNYISRSVSKQIEQDFTLATCLELQPTYVKVLIHQVRYDIPVSHDEHTLLELLQEEPLLLLPVSRDRRKLLLDRLVTVLNVLEELNDFEIAADSSVSSEGA